MTDFSVIEAKPYHCGAMVRRLRSEQLHAVRALGLDPHRELCARFEESSFRRAWLIDGRLAGLGGTTGSWLSTGGFVWLAIAQRATRHPKALVREARRQLAELMATRQSLSTTVLKGDSAAQRFALHLGFVPVSSLDGQRWLMVCEREKERPWASTRLH